MNGSGAFASFTTVGPATFSKTDREGVDTLQLYVMKSGVPDYSFSPPLGIVFSGLEPVLGCFGTGLVER
jgi:hypothetical protein